MVMLDTRTIFFVLSAICSAIALVFGLQSQLTMQYKGLRPWALGAASGAAGHILIALRGVIPDALSIVVANPLLVAAVGLISHGTYHFVGRTSVRHDRAVVACVVCVTACMVLFTYVLPSYGARVLVATVPQSALLLRVAWMLRVAPSARLGSSYRFTAVVAALFGLSLSIGIVNVIAAYGLSLDVSNVFIVEAPVPFTYIASTLLLPLMAAGLILLSYERLVYDLKSAQAREYQHLRLITTGAEAAVAQVRAELDVLVQHAPVGVAFLDRELRYELVNGRMAEYNALLPTAHLGRTVREVLLDEALLFEPQLRQVLETGQPVLGHEYAEPPEAPLDEQRVWVTEFYPVLQDGRVAKVGCLVREVTEERRIGRALREATVDLERQVAERTAELRRSEELFRLLADSSRDLITLQDRDLRLLYVSPSSAELVGYTPEEVLGRAIPEFVHPDDTPALQTYAEALLGGQTDVSIECRLIAKDGSAIFFETRTRAILGPDGRPTHYQSTARDISARKRADEELRRTSQELRRSNAALEHDSRLKDEFMAAISHELRTPLGVILGRAELLAQDVYGELSPRQREATAAIDQSGRQLLELIDDVLDISRIEAAMLTLERRPVALDTLCRVSLAFVQTAAETRRQQVSLTLDPSVTSISGDERRLRQVLVNLLSNAVKFTPEGGQIGLDVTGDPARALVHFTVWDTGIGIPAEKQSLLFRPFVQGNGELSREHGGIGLGLALVKRLVELHGGEVSLKSAPGEGSRFTVALPWVTAPAASSAPLPDVGARANATVLLAQEEDALRQGVADELRRTGFHVIAADDVAGAIAAARAEQPAVIVLDVHLTEHDDVALLRRLRALPEVADSRVVALSALVLPGDRERCLAAGADVFLVKPIDRQRLAEHVRQLAGERVLRLEA
ncbi:MAG: hypothetical protein RLZZ387_5532 [Chloroflexota bacterium]